MTEMTELNLPTANSIIYVLDMIGIFACTVAGTVLAKRCNMDMFGAWIVSFIGSVGGGTLRDLLLNRHPIFWLHDLNYLYVILVVSTLVQIFYHTVERLDRAMRWFDALGLAAFTVIGVQAALSFNMPPPIVMMMGAFTAIIGGVFRDIVCQQIPLVFQKEVYTTASVVGSAYYLLMLNWGMNEWLNSISTLILIFAIRMLAVYRGWNLPNLTLPKKT